MGKKNVRDDPAKSGALNFRKLAVPTLADGSPKTLDIEKRSVAVIGLTEQPAQVFDWERGEVITEVLRMDGVELPKKRQVPLLDSHNRSGTDTVLGSFRDIKTEGDRLTGTAYFSSAAEADRAFTKVREGHLTDFSGGYRPIESRWIADGDEKTIKGRSYKGPVMVRTRWRLKELSVTAIGADESATARNENEGENIMSEQERQAIERKAIEAERERVSEITGLGQYFEIPQIARQLVDDGTELAAAKDHILNYVTKNAAVKGGMGYRGPVDDFHHPAAITADGTDKRCAAQVDAMLLDAGLTVKDPAAGADELRGYSAARHAELCLRAEGHKVKGRPDEIIRHALKLTSRAMVSGDFPYLMGDYANKSALIGFDEARSPILDITRKISAKDFKTQYLIKTSEAKDLNEIPEHGEYTYASLDEHSEEYSLKTYGGLFAITRQALINDDLGLIANIGRAHGAAASRAVRDVVVAVLTGNSAMGDGTALFHADHSNFVDNGSGAAPSDTTLGAAYLAMRTQTGPNGAVLGIQPKYLIVPAALEVTAWKVLQSTGDLSDNKSSAVANPWYQRLELIPEPALDSDDAAAWYVSCDPQRFDGIVLSYLGGNDRPYLETRDGWKTDGVEYKVRIDVAAKAADWRGLYFNDGN